ncbi:hypothetical protein ACQ4PT_007825 [Festuca glaucescens]
MGFGERFLKWIALLLYTANTRVMVNGVPGDRVYHGRGLRQGDPTSPILFVAAMESLSAMITKAAEEGLFGNLATTSPLQRLSIYADDIVMFLKPENRELWASIPSHVHRYAFFSFPSGNPNTRPFLRLGLAVLSSSEFSSHLPVGSAQSSAGALRARGSFDLLASSSASPVAVASQLPPARQRQQLQLPQPSPPSSSSPLAPTPPPQQPNNRTRRGEGRSVYCCS